MTFYLNYFHDLAEFTFSPSNWNPENTNASSFQQASCLFLMTAFSQYEWRMPTFWSSLSSSFMINMTHPYKTIREKNAK